jgi:hypothetical protein
MKKIIKKIIFIFNLAGFDFIKFAIFLKGTVFYFKDYYKLKKQISSDSNFRFGKFFPILDEKNSESGAMKSHYFQQDLLVARKIFENKPIRHIDIGSRIDGFVAHVAVFRQIEVFDIRPLENNIKNIKFSQADLMQLPESMIECCDSLSSLHVIEHFGLGRYGDPIDKDGHIKAIQNLHKMLSTGGIFYFSVPIGPQRIEFNAHRVFDIEYLTHLFLDLFEIVCFDYVDDKGVLYENIDLEKLNNSQNFGCEYGCGIFQLKKI